MRVLAAVTFAAALAACGPQGAARFEAKDAAAPMSEAAVSGEVTASGGAPEAPAPSDPQKPAIAPLLLAYAYSTSIEAPAAAVEPLMKAHADACRAAGPAKCNVLAASTSTEYGDRVDAQLSLRAEPKWLETFRAGLEGEAKAVKGRIVATNVTAEDLTRQIVDTEARLRAQKTLRDRLQQMLRERPGKLSDLLETERELARVQGEIDSAESTLAVMRQRVDMSTLDLSYRSAPTAVTGGTFEPVADASASFLSNIAMGVAGLITFVGLTLPWLIVLIPLAWLIRRWWRARAARRAAARGA